MAIGWTGSLPCCRPPFQLFAYTGHFFYSGYRYLGCSQR